MEELRFAYGDLIKKVFSAAAKTATHITADNVYQQGDSSVLPYVDKMIEDLALPGSAFIGAENLVALFEKAKSGASCLILPEHYSNTDLPCFSYFLRKALPGIGKEIADSVVAVASMKLNEENPSIAAFASAYSRLVICPSRSLSSVDGKKDEEERLRVIQINRAAMITLSHIKKEKKLVLVFPAGTRYRPWDPSSKRGVREIDSYIKSFDYMCLVSVNGELLSVRQGGMIEDYVNKDVVHYTASPVISCAEFRKNAKEDAENKNIEDKKQAVVDAIMAELDKMHIAAEVKRQKLLEK